MVVKARFAKSGVTFAYQSAAFIAKVENRGKVIHVGQDNTVNAELTIIRE